MQEMQEEEGKSFLVWDGIVKGRVEKLWCGCIEMIIFVTSDGLFLTCAWVVFLNS